MKCKPELVKRLLTVAAGGERADFSGRSMLDVGICIFAMERAGLVKIPKSTHRNQTEVLPVIDITEAGQSVLDKMRDETLWEQTLKHTQRVGENIPLSLLLSLLQLYGSSAT